MTKRTPPQLRVVALPGERETAAQARAAVTPTMTAAATAKRYAPVKDVDLTALSAELTRQAAAVQAGDLSRAEEMLSAQAHTLDAIFNQLAARAADAQYLPQLEALLKLALRAQSQARSTWEAVSAIQHPPLAGYINQANIAGGHQQINNGTRAGNRARANPSSGANRWRMAGHRSDGRVPHNRFSNGGPGEHSTGPKTPEGKRRSAMRGYKGAVRPGLRALARALREQEQALERIR